MKPTFKDMSGGLTVYLGLVAILVAFLAYGVVTKPADAPSAIIHASLTN